MTGYYTVYNSRMNGSGETRWHRAASNAVTDNDYYYLLDSDGKGGQLQIKGDGSHGDNGYCVDTPTCPSGWVDMGSAANINTTTARTVAPVINSRLQNMPEGTTNNSTGRTGYNGPTAAATSFNTKINYRDNRSTGKKEDLGSSCTANKAKYYDDEGVRRTQTTQACSASRPNCRNGTVYYLDSYNACSFDKQDWTSTCQWYVPCDKAGSESGDGCKQGTTATAHNPSCSSCSASSYSYCSGYYCRTQNPSCTYPVAPKICKQYIQDTHTQSTGCGVTRLCGRSLSISPLKVTKGGSTADTSNDCKEDCSNNSSGCDRKPFQIILESYSQVSDSYILNSECSRTSSNLASGAVMTHNFNPCSCKTEYWSVKVKAWDGKGFSVFKSDGWRDLLHPLGLMPKLAGTCVAPWSDNLDWDGIGVLPGGDLAPSTWGNAGKNGHWVLTGGAIRGGAAVSTSKVDNGWWFDPVKCEFRCEGDAGNAASNKAGSVCFSQVLEPHIYFSPDLRTVVYNDPEREATWRDDGKGGNRGNSCQPTPSDQNTWGTEHPRMIGLLGGMLPAGRFTWARFEATGVTRDALLLRMISPLVSNPFTQTLMPPGTGIDSLNLPGGSWSTIFHGEDITGQVNLRAQFSNMLGGFFGGGGRYNERTVDCTCPTTSWIQPARDAGRPITEMGNCEWTIADFSNKQNICTTKRFYAMNNDCYSSAWWQVSGGNVYAAFNILDRVPNNTEGACGFTAQCLDSAIAANSITGYRPDFQLGPSGYQELLGGNWAAGSADGAHSCTPRMIRGRTPCKTDGPSNSAGVALTRRGIEISALMSVTKKPYRPVGKTCFLSAFLSGLTFTPYRRGIISRARRKAYRHRIATTTRPGYRPALPTAGSPQLVPATATPWLKSQPGIRALSRRVRITCTFITWRNRSIGT
jgi:hypothetical protein